MSFIINTVKESLHTLFPPTPKYLPKDYPDLKDKTVLITGCSAGVGKESAKLLLSRGATVIFVNRDYAKTLKLIDEIKLEQPDVSESQIISITVDLSDLSSIKHGVEPLFTKIEKLDIVILNAGVMQPPDGSKTKQGWELQFGTNVIGHQLLLDLIQPLINASSQEDGIGNGVSARVIWLSSASYFMSPSNGGLTWDFKDASKASTQLIYGQSKVSNIYQAYRYAQLHPNIISLAVHPGFLNSELFRYKIPRVLQPGLSLISYGPVYGAYTELFAALNPEITLKDTGKYVAPWGEFRSLIRQDVVQALNDGIAEKLWDYIEKEIEQYK